MLRDDLAERAQNLGDLQSCFINYDLVQEALRKLEIFSEMCRRSSHANIMLLYGNSGTGKSTIVTKYCEAFQKRGDVSHLEYPILQVSVPSRCTPKALASNILAALGDPCCDKGTLEQMTRRAADYIRRKGVRIILLDEFQHFIDRENKKVAHNAADWLKELSILIKCGIILVGLPSTRRIIGENEQLGRRVTTKVELKSLPFACQRDHERLQKILLLLADELPFENATDIAAPDMARRIYAATRGTMGRIVQLLNLAGATAVYYQESALSAAHFREAFTQLDMADVMGDGLSNPFL